MYTARSVRAKNDQEIWNGDLIKRMRGTPWDPRADESRAEFRVPEERHRPLIRWNTNTRNLRQFWDEMGKTAGCAACVSPKGNKHNVACLSRQEEWKSKIMLQSEHVRHADDTEGQTITHEASSSSTASNPNTTATHNRDIDKRDGNDDSENPGEWTPAKRIRMKSRPMSQPKRPREMTTILEDMERDDLQRMGTGSVASKRQGEQPEELTAKERKVENSAMDDQEPEDTSQTKARMDEMLMDQVMAVSCGTSRVCVNEEKFESATIRGLPADLVKKGQAREMKDLDDMKVLEWVKESTVPRDAKILDCGWARKMKSPSEVRARVVLKDYAVTKLDDLYAPTPTSMTVRCLLFYAAWFELEVSTSDVRVAFMHAVASEPKYANPPVEQRTAGWLWLIKKAMNGMRTASKDFGDLVAEVMNEIQFERGKADPQIYNDTKSQAAIVFHVDDPILASARHQTAQVWNRIGKHMLLKAHEVMTADRPIKYLSRQYVKVRAHGRRGFKVRLPQEYFDSISTTMDMIGCGTRAVPGRKKIGPTAGQVGQESRVLGAVEHSKYRAGVGKLQFMINEVPEIAYAVKNLSRQLAKPSESDMQELKQCVRYALGHSDEWLHLTVQDKSHKQDEMATIEIFTDADWAGDTKSMKSTSSVFTRIDGFIIGMNSQLQDTHAQSSGESEFYALGAGCADGMYSRAILSDLGMRAKINLRCDAKAARALAQRQGLSKRTRHVKVKYLYVQDLVKAKEVEVSRVPTETNLADVGTKHLASQRLEFLKSLMGKRSENATTLQADSQEQLDESDGKSTESQQG